jgi:hypothetical protein
MTYRCQYLLEKVRESPCQHCGAQDGTVVAAHSNQIRDGKGKGIKASDYRIAALCMRCHHEIDQGIAFSKEEKRQLWEAAHRATIGWLFEHNHIKIV